MKNKKLLSLLIGIFIFLYTAIIFSPLALMGQEDTYKDSTYSRITSYLGTERKTTLTHKLLPKDFILLTLIDTCLSLFCLWFTILLLLKSKKLIIKNYLWFLGVFNFAWFICLLIFKGFWQILVFLIIKDHPELQLSIIDSFSFFVIATAVSIYLWLLARTFKLNFFGALGTTLIFHSIYFVIILSLSFISPKDNKLFNSIEKHLGMKTFVHNYLLDVKKISTQKNLLSYIRFRPFHL